MLTESMGVLGLKYLLLCRKWQNESVEPDFTLVTFLSSVKMPHQRSWVEDNHDLYRGSAPAPIAVHNGTWATLYKRNVI